MATTYATNPSPSQAWGALVKKAFQHNKGILHGNPNLIVTDGVPDDSLPLGTLCWDVTNSDGYIATDGAGTWVKINA